MAVEPGLINCPHCTRSTSTADGMCVHCRALLDMDSVLLAESCRTSVVDGSTVGIDGPAVLMMYECRKGGNELTSVVIAVRANHVPGLRNSLLDRLMSTDVRTENGRLKDDQSSSDG